MKFDELSSIEQIELIKRSFEKTIEDIFNHPLSINRYVETGEINKHQAKKIREQVNTLNYFSCLCCRKFDRTKLSTSPINEALEPLIDITKKSLSTTKQKQGETQ